MEAIRTWTDTEQLCNKCRQWLPHSSFAKARRRKSGLFASCKPCQRLYYEANKDRIWAKNLKYRYGYSEDEYNERMWIQKGKCAICHSTNQSAKRLAVDHNSRTGQVRKLLCDSCNCMIGNAHESIRTLMSAISYLEQFKGSN